MAVRQGRSRPAEAPGRAARRLAPWLAVVALAFGVVGAWRWVHESDLRDAERLTPAVAEVVDVDYHRRSVPDDLVVAFPVAGGDRVTAEIPYSGSAGTGDEVRVAYVRDDPSRVRTVEGWSPAYRRLWVNAAMLALAAVALGVFGLVSRARRGTYEDGGRAPSTRRDSMGDRVVQGNVLMPAMLASTGLLGCGLLVWTGATQPAARDNIAGGLAVGVGFGAAAWLVWWFRRDAVWATPTHLVSRRGRRVRQWPWHQVTALGMVIVGGRPTKAAALIDDGLEDGMDEEDWVTLAAPDIGPLGAHRALLRLRALAEQRGLPFDERLSDDDLADGQGAAAIRTAAKRSMRSRAPDRKR